MRSADVCQCSGMLDLAGTSHPAEVAPHLEESRVTRGMADIFQIVVHASSAYATLRRHRTGVGTRVLAGEHVLELRHADVSEQQGRIIALHQRTAATMVWPLAAKKSRKL